MCTAYCKQYCSCCMIAHICLAGFRQQNLRHYMLGHTTRQWGQIQLEPSLFAICQAIKELPLHSAGPQKPATHMVVTAVNWQYSIVRSHNCKQSSWTVFASRYEPLYWASLVAWNSCDSQAHTAVRLQWCNCILLNIRWWVYFWTHPQKTTPLHIFCYKPLCCAILVASISWDPQEHTAMRMQWCNCVLPEICQYGVFLSQTPWKLLSDVSRAMRHYNVQAW